MRIDSLYSEARARHKAGRLSEAESAYRQILADEPRHADALHSLGLLSHQRGQHADAIELISQAIAINDRDASYHSNLGLALAALGRPDEAAAAFERAIELKPDHAIAYNNLGVIWLEQGRTDEARRCFGKAQRFSRDPDAHFNLGRAFFAERRFDAAIAELKRVVELRPDHADGHMQLGAAYRETGELESSLQAFIRAGEIRPRDSLPLCNQAVILKDLGRSGEAEARARRALELKPDCGTALNVLGVLQFEQGLLDESIETLRQATRAQPDLAGAHINLGVSLLGRGESAEAVARFEEALRIDPQNIDAHCNRAITWLARGEFETGWLEYEWRWQRGDSQKRKIPRPLWDGSPLDGKWILLHGEQGLGDTLQFVRYAQTVRERGGRVMLACPQSLIALLKRCPGIERLVPIGARALPAFDLHAPLLSLPCLCKTTVSNVPTPVPYLTADPDLVASWRDKLKRLPGLRVGIHWQGNPKYAGDRQRSMRLREFAPLAQIPGVTLISLQKGLGTEQIAELAGEMRVEAIDESWDEVGGAFMDSAAILMNLDLLVTSDSALAHLAGALGVPVWLALPFTADWRWLADRDDSPWYPTMRLFRQDSFGDWPSVFRSIANEIALVAGGDQSRLRPRHVYVHSQQVMVETSPGELVDKITILEIKSERMTDAAKLQNVQRELEVLREAEQSAAPPSGRLPELKLTLRDVNAALWDVEDRLRELERLQQFGDEFVQLARSVYKTNDRRAELKREINNILGSNLKEEKSYAGAALTRTEVRPNKTPAITVVMAVYNGVRFLERSIGSLLLQEFSDWELVVVDDGSSDDTFQLLQDYAERDSRIRPLRHDRNLGPSAARNSALRVSCGTTIVYLDCDDTFAPDHLEHVARSPGGSNVRFFCYEVWSEFSDGRPPEFSHVWDPIRNRDRLWERNISTPLGVTHSRQLLDRSGLFDETRCYEEDWDLWKRFARAGASFVFVPQIAGRYFVREDSLARTKRLPIGDQG